MSSIDHGVYAPPLRRDFAPIDPHGHASEEPRRGRMIVALSVAVLLALVGVIWSTYNQGTRERDDPPVLQALSEPYKVAPAEPGGEETEHLGVEVFNVLENGPAAVPPSSEVAPELETEFAELDPGEHPPETIEEWEIVEPHGVDAALAEGELLEPAADDEALAAAEDAAEVADEPVETAEAAAIPVPRLKPPRFETEVVEGDPTRPRTLETASDPTRRYWATRTPIVPTPAEEEGAAEPAEAGTPSPLDLVAAPVETATAPIVQAAAEPEPAPPVAPAPLVPGSFLVQLASFRSQDAADDAWSEFRSEFNDMTRSYAPNIERADLGDRGVHYRLRVGVFTDRGAATSFCDVVKARGRDCLVVGL